MSGRALGVLARFPAHLDAGREGKLLRAVADAFAVPLDALALELGAVRRAHRLTDAPELIDVQRLAALHGISAGILALLFARFARGRVLLGQLAVALKAADAGARDDAAKALCAVWGVPFAAFRAEGETAEAFDAAAAGARLAAAAGAALRRGELVQAVRGRVARAIAIHARGNGTVEALLAAAANALDLELGEIHHSESRFWHAAFARDRFALDRDGEAIEPARELLGLEENPFVRQHTEKTGRRHGELFPVLRRGFERVLLQVRIGGLTDRTVGPMFVNRDEGHGIGFAGTIGPAQLLVFGEDGRCRLDGSDVTPRAYAWRGACFAGDDASAERDFVFAAGDDDPAPRPARFAVAEPFDALDPGFVFPHAGASVAPPGIEVGETRFAFFVQQAHASLRDDGPPVQVERVAPRPAIGFFDGSVFAAGTGSVPEPAAEVELSWLEHEAYAVRVLIPLRFQQFDEDGAAAVQRVAAALERYRPLGVDVRVEYVDDRWSLGTGILHEARQDDPIGLIRAGTVLWPAPADA